MSDRIVPQQWMLQPRDIRLHLAKVFDIPRTGISEIRDQDVISDGHTIENLSAITLEKMCAYVGSEETFGRAWELTCAKAHSELHPPVGIIQDTEEKGVEIKPLAANEQEHGKKGSSNTKKTQ